MFESFLGVNPWTALFILLNTLTIYFVAKKFLFGSVMQIIEERQQEIDNLYTDADEAKNQAQQLRSEYECKLAEAQQTGERIVKEATARGHAREEDILRHANAEADAIRQKAAADIAQEKKKAINDAKDAIAGMAMDIAGKVVGRSLNTKDQATLVDQFIDQLGESL